MSIKLGRAVLNDFETSRELEWLETNGLGGYSSSSVCGCNTRSYHGLLVAAIPPPADRFVILSRLDESIEILGRTFSLATRDFGDAVFPQGYRNLKSFQKSAFPTWEFEIENTTIRKTLLSINGYNAICLRYEILESDLDSLTFSFEPFIAARSYHALQDSAAALHLEHSLTKDHLTLKYSDILPSINIYGPWIEYRHTPCWHNRFYYHSESERGLADREDLLCAGTLSCRLHKSSPLYILVHCDHFQEQSIDPGQIFENEIKRRRPLLPSKNEAVQIDDLINQLESAADQFIVKRDQGKTIIAGYHWFTDWGRDTLIAIRGLCLARGKLIEAQLILQVYCSSIKNGLIPNRFLEHSLSKQSAETESNLEIEYNTVDASLWLFIAAYELMQAGGDPEFLEENLFPALMDIYKSFAEGTAYEIKETKDGLISAGNEKIQLTWMDAKIGDHVVTPRHGKAVEINALWFNALNILKLFAERFGKNQLAESLNQKIILTEQSFQRAFWNDSAQCLYDVVRDDFQDASIRPNQIFAIGLPFPLFSQARAVAIISKVRQELLTDRGLRTLSFKDAAYKGQYKGNSHNRDCAYHQGTVWPWLLGVYMDALLKFESVNGLSESLAILSKMRAHISEAGIGTISEIFDGDPPHLPRGTIAQAWSVSELLRISLKIQIYAE